MTYTDEHKRMAAILREQWEQWAQAKHLAHNRATIKSIGTIIANVAMMYREQDPTFDYLRFLRETKGMMVNGK